MSTKLNPGPYDCLTKLADDEPYLVLRAKDPDAPAVVEFWVQLRSQRPGHEKNPKLPEALSTAAAMRRWREQNMSGRPCGCDPGANHVCAEHAAERKD